MTAFPMGSRGSLPLMGIGNEVVVRAPSGRLTTHYPSWGLETSWRGQAASPCTGPHYPSWGLETRRAVLSSFSIPFSLPLMGIGNSTARLPRSPRSSRAHYPSWGLETIVGSTASSAREQLITPHGDWKPVGLDNLTRLGVSHYPSWGLETS